MFMPCSQQLAQFPKHSRPSGNASERNDGLLNPPQLEGLRGKWDKTLSGVGCCVCVGGTGVRMMAASSPLPRGTEKPAEPAQGGSVSDLKRISLG